MLQIDFKWNGLQKINNILNLTQVGVQLNNDSTMIYTRSKLFFLSVSDLSDYNYHQKNCKHMLILFFWALEPPLAT